MGEFWSVSERVFRINKTMHFYRRRSLPLVLGLGGHYLGVWCFENNSRIAAFAKLAAKNGAEQSVVNPETSGLGVSGRN